MTKIALQTSLSEDMVHCRLVPLLTGERATRCENIRRKVVEKKENETNVADEVELKGGLTMKKKRVEWVGCLKLVQDFVIVSCKRNQHRLERLTGKKERKGLMKEGEVKKMLKVGDECQGRNR